MTTKSMRSLCNRLHGQRIARGGAAVGILFVVGLAPRGAGAQSCTPNEESLIVCGINGGTTSSSTFSPGSIIILSQRPLAFPGDLPEDALPDEAVAVTRARRFAFAGEATGAFGGTITAFAGGLFSSADSERTELEPASSTERRTAAIGFRFDQPHFTLAVGIDHPIEERDYDGGPIQFVQFPLPPASVDLEEIGFSVGGSFDLGRGMTAYAGSRVGFGEIDVRRVTYDLESVDFPEFDDGTNIEGSFVGRGTADRRSYSVETGAAYGRSLGGGLYGGLSGSLSWLREETDGYTERWPDGTETFQIGDDTRTSLASRVGIEVARPFHGAGATLVPSLRAAWFHEFADDSREIDVAASADVAAAGGDADDSEPSSFSFETNEPDRDYFTLGTGIAALFADDRGRIALDYEAVVGHDYIDAHIVRLELSYRF